MKQISFLFAAFVLSSQTAVFASTDPCGSATQAGDVCTIQVMSVHPTQFSVGMLEVQDKTSNIRGMSDGKLNKFLKKHTVPTVIGPNGVFFITDHHHLSRALYEVGVERMYLDIQFDWSSLSKDAFWTKMQSSQLVYLYDEQGQGPHPVTDLPNNVSEMRDDIYRSLAWSVQKDTGAYLDTNSPYASFLWANFFRTRVAESLVRNSYQKAIEQGANLARSPEAANLPGIPRGRSIA